MKSKNQKSDIRSRARANAGARPGRPRGSRMSLVARLERAALTPRASVTLSPSDILTLLPLLRLDNALGLQRFVSALTLASHGRMDRQTLDFMVDELLRIASFGPVETPPESLSESP